MTQTADHAENVIAIAGDGTYLAAWALTPDEALDPIDAPSGEVYISQELADADLGGDPDPSIDWFGGDLGLDKWNFDEDAADALLESNGYRRTGPWVAGTMNGQFPGHNQRVLTDGRSCKVVMDEIDPEPGLVERAMKHYHDECTANGCVYQQPGHSESMQYVIDHEREFVNLANINGSLTVYELVSGKLVSSSEDELNELLRKAETVGCGAL